MTATAVMLRQYSETDIEALYDFAAQMGMVLVTQYRASQMGAPTQLEADYWKARAELVARERAAMPHGDRAAILACMASWEEQCDALGPVTARR